MSSINRIPETPSMSNIISQPQVGTPLPRENVAQIRLNHAAYNSAMEFLPDQSKHFTEHNISNITDLLLKITALKAAIKDQNWDHEIFTLTNVNLLGIEASAILEFPFIALAGLQYGNISEEEFFIILCYYGLRCTYEKHDILAHPLFDAPDKHNSDNITLLLPYFVEGLKEGLSSFFYADVPNFSQEILIKLFNELRQISTSPETFHTLTLFSVPDLRTINCTKELIPQHPGKESENKFTLWDNIRMIPMHVFYHESRQFIPSLKIYEVFLKYFLGVSPIYLKPRIGFSLNQDTAFDAQNTFDVAVPFPTFHFNLDSFYYNLFYQGLKNFATSNKTHTRLMNIVKQLRTFETTLNLPENLRHQVSNSILNAGFVIFNKFKYDEHNVLSFLERSRFFKISIKNRLQNPLYQPVLDKMDLLLNQLPRLG